jgi:predicted regulator of Ras-like GTPase activity (Roadblock/LC7/MglB family)
MRVTTGDPELDRLVDDLVRRVPSISQVVVLSSDGLLMSASSGVHREDAEHLAAVAAGFQSLALGAGQRFSGGRVRQTIIDLESSFLFVTAAGSRACLAVLADAEADLGLVAYELVMLAGRVARIMRTPPRPAAAPSDAA